MYRLRETLTAFLRFGLLPVAVRELNLAKQSAFVQQGSKQSVETIAI